MEATPSVKKKPTAGNFTKKTTLNNLKIEYRNWLLCSQPSPFILFSPVCLFACINYPRGQKGKRGPWDKSRGPAFSTDLLLAAEVVCFHPSPSSSAAPIPRPCFPNPRWSSSAAWPVPYIPRSPPCGSASGSLLLSQGPPDAPPRPSISLRPTSGGKQCLSPGVHFTEALSPRRWGDSLCQVYCWDVVLANKAAGSFPSKSRWYEMCGERLLRSWTENGGYGRLHESRRTNDLRWVKAASSTYCSFRRDGHISLY